MDATHRFNDAALDRCVARLEADGWRLANTVRDPRGPHTVTSIILYKPLGSDMHGPMLGTMVSLRIDRGSDIVELSYRPLRHANHHHVVYLARVGVVQGAGPGNQPLSKHGERFWFEHFKKLYNERSN